MHTYVSPFLVACVWICWWPEHYYSFSVVAHPLGEAILNLSAAEGGIALRLFSEDMSDFLFYSPSPFASFAHSGRSVG